MPNKPDYTASAHDWVEQQAPEISQWHQTIFDYAETAWREYRSCAWYVEKLRAEGFTVEEGTAGMPTAFCATWENGTGGPTIGGYAEYDAVPGNCQAADVVERPRDGLSKHAGGHTDPHSALGIGSLAGFLAAKAAMEKHNIPGRLKFLGEPAEKQRASKPLHAAKGYYDDMDAAISFHPCYMLPLTNTTRWNTHCGAAFVVMYTFECNSPETWLDSGEADSPIAASHASARAPGANDALVQMYSNSKMLKEHLVAAGCGWSMNESITLAGQATADNLPAQIAQIHYIMRVPTIEMAERIVRGLDQNAAAAASTSHCTWKKDWIAKSRPGLPNHAMAQLTYDNLELAGAPQFNTPAAIAKAQQIQKNLGMEVMDKPFMEDIETLITPQEAETILRKELPEWQKNFTSDDYTEYCWHAPTVRLYIGRPMLKSPGNGGKYPAWVMNALGGIAETIDPMIFTAGKTIAGTILDLLCKPGALEQAQQEFNERTGGGIGGSEWVAPLCDYPAPIHFRWPEYVQTERGHEWWIPTQPHEKN
ncbi:amidohydrolase [Dasania sp. GY-MA-18]|uniref:Amidohydrolase n=1 Tax=Dasania phycosphaerae TaxID=2950436 RepID=A0A9J6RLJ9_9GAMM|nr:MULTISPECIES: amidohydrolase [Dasania]MCR8922633.1 amidohydrolase [Dasania sp. GY-MA-18]MCZ0865063.1 amidohydrolase [Dasania phycosphaerae]MCZ0868789.1 amidohydrolase [Dasania phycosphaerae]